MVASREREREAVAAAATQKEKTRASKTTPTLSFFHAQPSSVHWHGMRQVATQIMDGPTFVTQRLVGGADGATNASTGPPAFLYDFVLREGEKKNGWTDGWMERERDRDKQRARASLLSQLSLSLLFTHPNTGGAYWYHR